MILCFDFKKIVTTMVFIILPSLVFAGGMEGGGGKSIVCRDSQGKITRAEVLDLFEGRIQYGLKYVESDLAWNEQVLNLFTNAGLPVGYSIPNSEIIDWYRNAIDHLVILPEDITLKPTNDSFEVMVPKGCQVEQAAIYKNDTQILINGEIWNAFSETQKAALLIHESTYRYLRSYGETNSKRTRHFTAYLLSGAPIKDTFPGNDYRAVCFEKNNKKGTEQTMFYVLPPFIDQYGNERVRLQFFFMGGRKLLSESYIEIANKLESGRTFLDELKNPQNEYIYQAMSTKSLFEGGDILTLRLGRGENGEAKIQITDGVSSVDESSFFTSALKCLFKP